MLVLTARFRVAVSIDIITVFGLLTSSRYLITPSKCIRDLEITLSILKSGLLEAPAFVTGGGGWVQKLFREWW
jgi:hypothetical protein